MDSSNWLNVHFHPWEGTNYRHYEDSLHWLLILGESGRGEEHEDVPSFTQETITSYLDPDWYEKEQARRELKSRRIETAWKMFFTKIHCAIAGKRAWQLSDPEHKEFWDSVAFYNYFQGSLLSGPKDQGFRADLETDRIAFLEVLGKLTPRHIFVFSKRLWDMIPIEGREEVFETSTGPAHVRTLMAPSGNPCTMLGLSHPAAPGFSYDRWSPIIREYLERYP